MRITPMHEAVALTPQSIFTPGSGTMTPSSSLSSGASSPMIPTQTWQMRTSPQSPFSDVDSKGNLADSPGQLSDACDLPQARSCAPRRGQRRTKKGEGKGRVRCNLCDRTYGRTADLSRHIRCASWIRQRARTQLIFATDTWGEHSQVSMVW